MEELLAPKPSAAEVLIRSAVAIGVETVILFFMLVAVLHLLRRWMDLTFPDPPVFYRNVLIMAVAAAGLWSVPFVGWILALATVGMLTMKFFDGDALSGLYVALALWGTHLALAFILLARLRGGR